MTRKPILISIVAIIVLLLAGFAYYFFMGRPTTNSISVNNPTGSTGFVPLNRNTLPNTSSSNSAKPVSQTQNTGTTNSTLPIPTLRLLSTTPIGGYGASTTASTTAVRWIDRGRGNVYQTLENTLDVQTLSNTVLPRVYDTAWDKNLTSFVGSMLPDNTDAPTTVLAKIIKTPANASSTDQNVAPFSLKGSDLPDTVIGYAISPRKDKIFLFTDEGGVGVGYVAKIDLTAMTRIFGTPLTQVNVDWPEDNTIAITTKSSASTDGYLYFVNPQTGVWKKIVGPVAGLDAKVSHDAKYVLLSATGDNQNVSTSIYTVAKSVGTDAVVRTLAQKCTWGNFYKNMVYCAVPSQITPATYPDDWLTGSLSSNDKIWQVNASTGEVHLISSIIDQSDRVIDGFNLSTDPKDNYLLFMNKKDLTLWSLDLVSSH